MIYWSLTYQSPYDKPLYYAGKWREFDPERGFWIDEMGNWKLLWQL